MEHETREMSNYQVATGYDIALKDKRGRSKDGIIMEPLWRLPYAYSYRKKYT
jgi:hypothetical protein